MLYHEAGWSIIARSEVFNKIENDCDDRFVSIGNTYCGKGEQQKLCNCENCPKITNKMIGLAVEECKKLKANFQCPTCKKNMGEYCGIEHLKKESYGR